jgi:hypothetical protein
MCTLLLAMHHDTCTLFVCRVEPGRPGFHTSSHIFPLGYTASAKFPSSVQPGIEVAYTCMVADGGPAGPLFVVVVPDAPGQQWLGPTPDAVWQQVQQRVSATHPGCVTLTVCVGVCSACRIGAAAAAADT